jgi:hypothetical protein
MRRRLPDTKASPWLCAIVALTATIGGCSAIFPAGTTREAASVRVIPGSVPAPAGSSHLPQAAQPITPLAGGTNGESLAHLAIQVAWPEAKAGAARQIAAIDAGAISQGAVSVTGPGIIGAVTATMSLVAGAAATVSVDVPTGPNRVVEVRGLDAVGRQVAPGAVLRGVVTVPEDSAIALNPETTLAGDVLLALRILGSARESDVDRKAIGGLIGKILRPDGGRPISADRAWAVHPSLVDARKIAADIHQTGAVPQPKPAYLQRGGTVLGYVGGLLFGQTADLILDDPASLPATTSNGEFAFYGVTPGIPMRLTFRSPFYTAGVADVEAVEVDGTGSVQINLVGNYIKRRLMANGCGLSSSVGRFSQLPIRVLSILPQGANSVDVAFNDDHTRSVRDSLTALESEFPGALRFELTEVPETASDIKTRVRQSDIYVRWYRQLKKGCSIATVGCMQYYPETGNIASCETDPVVKNRTLQGRIRLATHHQIDESPLSYRTLRRVALHEILHALGLDHSSDAADVMYETTLSYFAHNISLSERDRNTLRFLYSLPANFTRDHGAFDLVPESQNNGFLVDP